MKKLILLTILFTTISFAQQKDSTKVISVTELQKQKETMIKEIEKTTQQIEQMKTNIAVMQGVVYQIDAILNKKEEKKK